MRSWGLASFRSSTLGATSRSLPLNSEARLRIALERRDPGLSGISEKQYQFSSGLSRNCRFFLKQRPGPDRAPAPPRGAAGRSHQPNPLRHGRQQSGRAQRSSLSPKKSSMSRWPSRILTASKRPGQGTNAQVRRARRSAQARPCHFVAMPWADSAHSCRYKRGRARGSANFQGLDETVGQERFLLLPY
jgi:hypothetical protein